MEGSVHPLRPLEGSAARLAALTADSLVAHEQREGPLCYQIPNYGAPYYFHLTAGDGRLEISGDDLPADEVWGWLADSLRSRVDDAPESEWPVGIISGDVGGRIRHFAYALAGSDRANRDVFGFEIEPERYGPLFERAFTEKPLLPSALTAERSNGDLVAVRVESSAGDPLFSSAEETDWALASLDPLAPRFGGLVVRAVVRPDVAGSLIIGGLPRSRLPYLISLFLLSAALAVVAVGQLRRDGELARLRSDFVSSVSHELRTPLAQVRLFLETFRLGRYSTPSQREWLLDNVERETVRLSHLVDNVLHFSQVDRGVAGGMREPVQLSDLLTQVVHAFEPFAASRRVQLEVNAEPGLTAMVHEESFRRVILNLFDNAVKYGPTGQTVRVAAHATPMERVRVVVEDEGPGVDPHDRNLIWEPFRRGDRAIGSVAVGSGIGLSVVREIVNWHGGRSWVENRSAGGARFVVELPCVPRAERSYTEDGGTPAEPAPMQKVG